MVRYCAVPNCSSGRRKDQNERQRLGKRQASLFNIPKSMFGTKPIRHEKCNTKRNNMLQKWRSITGWKLAERDLICELHFSKDDIKKEDRFTLVDGSVAVIPRERWELKEGAIPIAITDKENLSLPPVLGRHENERIPVNTSYSAEIAKETALRGTDHRENDVVSLAVHLQESRSKVLTDVTNEWSNISTDSHCSKSRTSDNVPQDGGGFRSNLRTSLDSSFENGEDPARADSIDPRKNTEEPTRFTIDDVFEYFKTTTLPETWSWFRNRAEEASVTLVQISRHSQKIRLYLDIHSDLSVAARTPDNKKRLDLNDLVTSTADLADVLKVSGNETIICEGSGMVEDSRAEDCHVFITTQVKFVQTPRCDACRKLRQMLQHRHNRRKTTISTRYARLKHASQLKQRSRRRFRNEVKNLRQEITRARQECAAIKEHALNDAICKLPEAQQESVQACLNASKAKGPKQRRYSLDWVYECLLMRIKSSRLYDHIRSRNIMPLPCKDTLSRYIQKLNPGFGFQKAVFDCLRVKASSMEVVDRRGTLLIDGMALSEAISLDRKTMKFNGFVDLGEHTPAELQNTRGDHALVFMYQPFRGPWVQVLGCFLSKDSVTSNILHKLILECIVLLSRSGFHTDVVAMDGAQWNRGVWKMFGIGEENLSCEHPCDPTHRLRMISDFPHLLKCFRNGIVQLPSFSTPDGMVKKQHWETILTHEGYTKPNMRVAYTLTPAHLNPIGYQKMNVPMAFQLFSDRVSAAMELYKEDPKCTELADAAPTIAFIRRVDDVIKAMMSRTPGTALRPLETCPHKKAIEDFLMYLREWKSCVNIEKKILPISTSTFTGFIVTLESTLQLLQFLHDEFQYDYLMTARVNQDALERFFGMMRNACGSNDHPDPILFAQVFRLLCSYSLVKPPKGSNMTGTELLQTLMATKESMSVPKIQKKEFFSKIDALIEGQCCAEISLEIVQEQDHAYTCSQPNYSQSHMSTHDYDVVETNEEVLAYLAGYVARKARRFMGCADCLSRLVTSDRCQHDIVIDIINRFDGLVYPSEELFKLTKTLERAVLGVVGTQTVKENTLLQILDTVGNMSSLTMVGCMAHEKDLTKHIVSFYLVMRGHFLADSINENYNARKIKTKTYRKRAKL